MVASKSNKLGFNFFWFLWNKWTLVHCEVFLFWTKFQLTKEACVYQKTAVFTGKQCTLIIWKHSSRMCTARWPTICALVITRCQYQWRLEGSSSEQVWTGLKWWPSNVVSRGQGQGSWHVFCREGLGPRGVG